MDCATLVALTGMLLHLCGVLLLVRWVTESGVDPGGDVLAVKPAAAAIGVGYLRARGAEEAMEAAKAMLDQACALPSPLHPPQRGAFPCLASWDRRTAIGLCYSCATFGQPNAGVMAA